MRGKKYHALKEKVPAEPVDVSTATNFLKENIQGKFDETVELHIHLGVDPSKSDQIVRGTLVFPSGLPTQKTIAVFAEAEPAAAAKEAGAAIVGGEELIEHVLKSGTLSADVVIATPTLMAKVAKVARILGPKGLMPNPKTGTVTPNPAEAIQAMKAGKRTFKMDQLGNIHEAVAKVSWPAEKITANIDALLEAVRAVRPIAMKGQLIKTVTVKTTMSPAVRVSI